MSSEPAPRRRVVTDMPIKRKLMVIIMVVTTAALAVSGLALVVADSVLFRDYLKRDLGALARITADNSTAALAFDDPESARETLSHLQARTHVVAACLYRPDGARFAEYLRPGSNAPCPPPGPADGLQFEMGAAQVTLRIALADRPLGALVLLYDMGELAERMRLYGAAVGGILLLSALMALLLSSRLQTLIATPITELARTSAAVSETRDYGIRAEKFSQDELGVLVDAFNSMLAGIQSRDQDLRQALVARESALTEAQSARDLLRTTLASIGDAVVSTDSAGCVVFANPVACQLMGYREHEIAGRNLDDVLKLVNEKTRQPVESPVNRALREGTIVGLANHTILIARDGTNVPIDDSAAPIRDSRGKLAGVVLIFRDITERKRAEEQLRATREQLQLVTDTMAPAVTHCSRELKYVWVSRPFAEWLHSAPEAISGKAIVDVIGPQALAVIEPHIHRVLDGQRVEYEAEVNFAPIGRRWIRAVYVPTLDRDGTVTGWVADDTDITALKNAQAEIARINADLKKSNQRLARSNEDLAGFAFAASHDLQEPLRMITTYVELLVRGLPKPLEGDMSMFVSTVVDAAARMRSLLADLLAYSEIGGEPDEPIERVDLNQVLANVRQNLKVALEESGAQITSDPLPAVAGYSGHFLQLFQNLVGNAIKYRGPEQPRVHITCARDGSGKWLFRVLDNGIGIDPQYHNKIFGIFKRLHGKKIPGTGMGLAICQRVVERYYGRLWVESEAGRGSTFCFTLPPENPYSAAE